MIFIKPVGNKMIAVDKNFATLAAGQTITVNAAYKVQEEDLGNAQFTNTAAAKAEDGPDDRDTTDGEKAMWLIQTTLLYQ